MSRIAQAQFRSRLGNLLINKGLVTEQQLAQAVDHQKVSGLRLGEALVSLGHLTENQINKALRRQSSMRFAATLATAMMMPFQVVKADTVRIESEEPKYAKLQTDNWFAKVLPATLRPSAKRLTEREANK